MHCKPKLMKFAQLSVGGSMKQFSGPKDIKGSPQTSRR